MSVSLKYIYPPNATKKEREQIRRKAYRLAHRDEISRKQAEQYRLNRKTWGRSRQKTCPTCHVVFMAPKRQTYCSPTCGNSSRRGVSKYTYPLGTTPAEQRSIYGHEWYLKNIERHRQLGKELRLKNADIIKRQKREYYQKNRSIINAKNKANYLRRRSDPIQLEVERQKSRERMREYRAAHPDYNKRQSEKWIASGRAAAAAKIYRLRHPEKIKAYKKRYAVLKPETVRAIKKREYEKNKHLYMLHTSLRRARVLKATGGSTPKQIRQLFKEIYSARKVVCHLCGKSIPKSQRAVDHIFPIARGGKHECGNLAPAHKRCNNIKYDKLIVECGDIFNRDERWKTFVAKRVKDRRLQMKMLQVQLAKTAGFKLSQIRRIEQGKANLAWKTLEKIAQALRVSLVHFDPDAVKDVAA